MERWDEVSFVAKLVGSSEAARVSVMPSRPRGSLPVLLPVESEE